MITLRKRGQKWQVDFYYDHPLTGERVRFKRMSPYTNKTYARSWGHDRLAECIDKSWWERQTRAEDLDRGDDVPLLKDFVESDFIPALQASVKDSTLATYRARLNIWIIPHLGEQRLSHVAKGDVDDMIAAMQDAGLTDKSVKNCCGVLSRLYREAIEREVVATMPKIVAPTVSYKGRPDYFSKEEVKRILREGEAEPAITNLLQLAVQTGMRMGELMALEWRDIDWKAGLIGVRRNKVQGKITTPKNGKGRDIPVSDDLIAQMKTWRAEQDPPSSFVFAKDGESMTKGMVYDPLARVYERAGIPLHKGRGLHILRHTYATHVADSGIPIRTLQEILGHATLDMTMRYVKVTEESKRRAVSAMSFLTESDEDEK